MPVVVVVVVAATSLIVVVVVVSVWESSLGIGGWEVVEGRGPAWTSLRMLCRWRLHLSVAKVP
jgi:hypothetical protein